MESNLNPPPARLRNLSDGCVLVTVGEFRGMVSSHHLIEQKIVQLRELWAKFHDSHENC